MKARRQIRSSALSLIVSATAALGALIALDQWCYVPYRCNAFKRSAESSMLAIQNVDAPMRRAMIARQNLDLSLSWLRRCPNDIDLYMIAAGSFRQLGRSGDAIPMYEAALLLDRRPEIYLNLGQSQAEANQDDDAIVNLARAVRFDPSLIDEVPAALQERVQGIARVGRL